MVDQLTFVRDTLLFLKTDLLANITDPISSGRSANSKFILTSYPVREAQYPIITIKATNYSATRVGMGIDAFDMLIELEIRVWARNTRERDEIFTDVFNRLRNIQFTNSGSTENQLHDFNMPFALELDEEKVKSKIINVTYKFFNFT